MTNLEINQLAKNPEFRKRIESAIVLAATQISGENPVKPDPAPDLTVIQAQRRHNKATTVLNDSQNETPKFAYAAAAQAGLNSVIGINEDGSLNYTGGASLDGDIAFIITNIWDDMSGVSYADLQA